MFLTAGTFSVVAGKVSGAKMSVRGQAAVVFVLRNWVKRYRWGQVKFFPQVRLLCPLFFRTEYICSAASLILPVPHKLFH